MCIRQSRALYLAAALSAVAVGCGQSGTDSPAVDAGAHELDAMTPAAGSGGETGHAGAAGAVYGGEAGNVAQPPGETRLVGVSSFGLRARSDDGAEWTYCGNPAQADEHTPDLLRALAYGDGVFIAVGGNMNGRVMRSLDAEHWDEDVHPLDACPEEGYPSSCSNWMGAIAYLDGVWLAGGGNGATMRSTDAGRSWQGLHRGFPEKHIRSLGAGAGHFIAGTDGGELYVSADHGDSWQAKPVWSGAPSYASLHIVFGRNTFIAYSEEGDACFTSNDLGQTWLPCATAAQGGSAYLFDGRQWVAATSGAYLTSPDANAWTRHPVALMPRRLLFDGTTYFGRSEDTHYRASTLTAFEVVATRVPDFRAWTLGRVLAENLPVLSPAACVDHR